MSLVMNASVKRAVLHAHAEAVRQGSPKRTEHLLIGLLETGAIPSEIIKEGITVEDLCSEIKLYVTSHPVAGQPGVETKSYTVALEIAAHFASRNQPIDEENLLVGVLSEGSGYTSHFILSKLGVDHVTIHQRIIRARTERERQKATH